jgi:hypothetical protein
MENSNSEMGRGRFGACSIWWFSNKKPPQKKRLQTGPVPTKQLRKTHLVTRGDSSLLLSSFQTSVSPAPRHLFKDFFLLLRISFFSIRLKSRFEKLNNASKAPLCWMVGERNRFALCSSKCKLSAEFFLWINMWSMSFSGGLRLFVWFPSREFLARVFVSLQWARDHFLALAVRKPLTSSQ